MAFGAYIEPPDFAQQLLAMKARIAALEAALALPRRLYGSFTAAGAIVNKGSGGWTVVRNAAGNYTITYTTAFLTEVTVVGTATPSAAGINTAFAIVANAVGSVNLIAQNPAGAPADAVITFEAIGI